MPTTIKAVSPFYNDKGNSPLPFSPRLTDQLELFRKCSGQFTSVAKEVEDGSPLDYDPKPLKRCLKAPTSSSSDKSASASSPYPKKTTSQSVWLRSRSLAVSTSSESSKPGHGGYTLETALDWNRKAFTKFKKFTHQLIDEHLDINKCASAQDHALLKAMREKAVDAFPDLENYANCWPVNDLIMMRLKYTSSCSRGKETEVMAGKWKSMKGLVCSIFVQPWDPANTSKEIVTFKVFVYSSPLVIFLCKLNI
ncbi:hypothetical protein SCLCIDRAFT_122866 [Scleroderma citrinum Foug A]|uniref:Uncharacterized protein n=1 Tax=Scleroderma citrinum Foug A TaxID=1036808 RepID=A0A0C2ZHS0_9AGAM|nr:hypothetical protein SCLCIDRAFT_122866 [Scleroderma citrinum Foug A]